MNLKECEDCPRVKEIANEKILTEMDLNYHIEAKMQLKKELDEAKNKLESIEKILKNERKK